MRVTNNMGKNSISFHKWQISGKRKVPKKVKLPNSFTKPFESSVDGDPYGNRIEAHRPVSKHFHEFS